MRVNARLTIPESELVIRATRSSGAGGQHVNKTASRVEVVWNVRTSEAAEQALTPAQRDYLLERLAGKLTAEGELRIVASDTRSQYRNRELAEARLGDTVRRALVVPKIRKPTAPTRAARQARLDDKRRLSSKKQNRQRPVDD